MRVLASALSEAGARGWIWAVIAGLLVGGVLVVHAGLAIVRALPVEVRAGAATAIKKRPRLVVLAAAVAAWTLVYGLYSLAHPSGAVL